VQFQIITQAEESISQEVLAEYSAIRVFPKGSSLLALYGANAGNFARLGIPAATNQAVLAIWPKDDRICGDFLYCWLRSLRAEILKWRQGSGQPNLSGEMFQRLSMPVPPLAEQRQIADVLMTWDQGLGRLARLTGAKQTLFAALRESLTSRSRHLKPLKKTWSVVALAEVTHQMVERNRNRLGRDDVMGVLKKVGLTPMKEHVIAGDIDRYLVVPPHAFAYNPMRINIGSIAMSDLNRDVIVSPDYVVFACDPKKLLPGYLNHLRRTQRWVDFVTVAGNGSVRIRIYYADLAEFEFPLPRLEQQRLIVDTLDDGERELSLLRAEYLALERQRDSLATQLLTGRLRVKQAGAPFPERS
jgi:type I restriction enzyme, S subunit